MMNEPLKNLVESQKTGAPTSGIEGRAVVAGLVAAVVWYISEKIFFNTLIATVGEPKYIDFAVKFGVAFAVIVVSFSLAQGAFIGFVTAFVARRRYYLLAIGVVILANIAEFWIHRRSLPSGITLPPSYFYWHASLVLGSLVGALLGVYLVQSTKRRRFVRIQ